MTFTSILNTFVTCICNTCTSYKGIKDTSKWLNNGQHYAHGMVLSQV